MREPDKEDHFPISANFGPGFSGISRTSSSRTGGMRTLGFKLLLLACLPLYTSCGLKTTYRTVQAAKTASLSAFPTVNLVNSRKVLVWTPNSISDHIAYYTVWMRNSGGWFRIAYVYDPQILLPQGNYTRTFAVSATNPELPGEVMESPKSAPITVRL